MWCVPTAIAAVTGLSREQVWLDILAQRQARGRRLTNIPGPISEPHGGCHAAEGLRVVQAHGYTAQDAWPGTMRRKIGEFVSFAAQQDERDQIDGSLWLVLQPTHLAYFDTLDNSNSFVGPTVVKAWRITRVPQAPKTLY